MPEQILSGSGSAKYKTNKSKSGFKDIFSRMSCQISAAIERVLKVGGTESSGQGSVSRKFPKFIAEIHLMQSKHPLIQYLLVLAACLNFFFLQAQHTVPGTVYFKVTSADVRIPVFSNNTSGEIPPEWQASIDHFRIQEIVKPFRMDHPEVQKIYRVCFDTALSSAPLVKWLQGLEGIQYAEPAQRYFGHLVPNDVDARQQWYLNLIQAFDAWDIGVGSSSIGVAIVDDAIKTDHPDLAPVIWTNSGEVAGNGSDDDGNGYIDDVNGYDVADNDGDARPPASGLWQLLGLFTHGTHCAGIAGAATNNGLGVASIGHGIRIIPVKATSNSSLIPLAIDRGNEGVDYAVASGAKVISMSWGGATQDSTLTNVIQAAAAAGRILVSAAGNDGNSTPNYPSALPGVICVGSVSRGDIVSSFSQRGTMIDVMAPGDSIYSTLATNAVYGFQSGTSMACPMVAGLCGLMLSQNPSADATTIESCLKNTCDNIDGLNSALTGQLGAGRINARNALACISMMTQSAKSIKSGKVAVYPNPGSEKCMISSPEMTPIQVVNALGVVVTEALVLPERPLEIQTRAWPSGMYFIKLANLQDGSFQVFPWIHE
jgi:subtilisin family serine protease